LVGDLSGWDELESPEPHDLAKVFGQGLKRYLESMFPLTGHGNATWGRRYGDAVIGRNFKRKLAAVTLERVLVVNRIQNTVID